MKRTINLFLLMALLFLSITTFPATARDILDPARNPSNTGSASVAPFGTDPVAEGFNVPGYGSWGNTGATAVVTAAREAATRGTAWRRPRWCARSGAPAT
uniref:Uncharacterized protein n=1 Tax=Ananas comosus var. bracteatus TaxID=296719 RepID=A0A6V7NLN3_ANACO|nr:unnamed protein product [Ananas comosus var. bracteatus]